MSTTAISIIILLIGAALFLFYYLFSTPQINPNDFKSSWRSILLKRVDFYNHLVPEEKKRFEHDILTFFQKVKVTGVDTKIYDVDRILVASSAVIPLFGYPGSSFNNLSEVLIYKDKFNVDYETDGTNDRHILGMVGSGHMNRHMILSKKALRNGYNQRHKSHNVGIHEFVHLLDKADGDTDGIPAYILRNKEIQPWKDVVVEEIKNILKGNSTINPYGATNEAEFFSVASEYFFMQPKVLHNHHPNIYYHLKFIYKQDPAQGLGRLVTL